MVSRTMSIVNTYPCGRPTNDFFFFLTRSIKLIREKLSSVKTELIYYFYITPFGYIIMNKNS